MSTALLDPPKAADPGSCHGGRETMLAAARAAGKSESLDKYAADYPKGPHDQPQSMCPAFGALRVGLRMRRVATILSGSACCVYGLTFTSHFYGAKRTVGYVPFNSESLVRGQLYEDIRDAVFETAKPADYDAVVVINLCVPTASGVPLDLLPRQIEGVRVIGIDVPGFGVRRMFWPAPCCVLPGWRQRPDRYCGHAPPAICRPLLCSASFFPPIHLALPPCWRPWGWPWHRNARRGNGATCMAR
jgi:hypothetical protein